MNTFTLTIELGNDAMQDEHDVTRALDYLLTTGAISGGWTEGVIFDDNGNAVGKWSFQEETEAEAEGL